MLYWLLDAPKNWIQESRGGVVGVARGPGGHRTTAMGIPKVNCLALDAANGLLYAGAGGEGKVLALAAATGEKRWELAAPK